tara:strand:- start:1793 stop:2119 length:327 start_codon:yes stop_codon:yes gene_type:complete
MNCTEKRLAVCLTKHIESMDRESQHAAAAAILDEGVVYSKERIETILRGKKRKNVHELLAQFKQVLLVLTRSHDAAAELQTKRRPMGVPLVRLGPGGDYIFDITEDDV